MQDAYYVDQQTIGNWTQIGYKEPASNNFTYTGKDAVTGKTWIATAKFDASDCTGADKGVWSITTSEEGTAPSKSIKYQASDNCPALTPNFKNIGAGSVASGS